MKLAKCLSMLYLIASGLFASDNTRIETILEELVSIEKIETKIRFASEWDPFVYPRDEVSDIFEAGGRLKFYPSTYANNRERYDAYRRYEALMSELSSFVTKEIVQSIPDDNWSLTEQLLLEVAYDLSLGTERYREVLEFYNHIDRRNRNLQKGIRTEDLAEKFEGKNYLYVWAYYLYAPEVVPTYWLDRSYNGVVRGRIVHMLSKLDEGKFYSFVTRQLKNDVQIVEQDKDSLEEREGRIEAVMLSYLIRYPNLETLELLQSINNTLATGRKKFKASWMFGFQFFKALKPQHSEQRESWESLFEEAEKDAAFTEFLKGYHSKS